MTVHLLISGKVQGVYYRAEAKEQADILGIGGWIRNRYDDNVEAVVSGSNEKINEFVSWCHHGPRLAKVTGVIIQNVEDEDFQNFKIVR